MTITISHITFLTVFTQQTHFITVQNPSEDVFQKLYTKYSATLQCPCNQLEISYRTFINLSYTFHPVCSSVFVSKYWINLLFQNDMTHYFPFDFRSASVGHFQLLTSLCAFAQRIVQDAIDDFLSSSLLSPEALSSASLEDQCQARSYFVERSTAFAFRRLRQLVRDTTQMNGLQPAMQTSKMHLMHVYPDNTIDATALETIWPGNRQDPECFCGITSNCYASIGFYRLYAAETEGVFQTRARPSARVTGFKVGCYALDGLLSSTLECFYNSSCLETVLTYFPISNITKLDVLDVNQTRYSSEETIEIIANALFLEQRSMHVTFSTYYSTCAPRLCKYKVTRYASALQVLTTLLGVYGGLTLVLRMIVLHTVHFWRNYQKRRRTELQAGMSKSMWNMYKGFVLGITLAQHLRNTQTRIQTRLNELNLFKTNITRTDPHEQKTGKISTWIYLPSLLLASSIIVVYLLVLVQVHTNIVEKPSRTIYENLYNKYATTLQCPCSHIANQYALFTSISPVFHPICSSLYISEEWIVSISSLNNINSLYHMIDFRTAGPTFFNALKALCLLTNATIADAWYIFIQSSLITDLTLTKSEFEIRTKLAIEQFQENTIDEFNRLIALAELHARTMYTTGYTDYILIPLESSNNSTTQIDYQLIPIQSENCSCNSGNECLDVMSFFTYTDTDGTMFAPYYLNFTLSDIVIGCYVISSVQQSSLGCFFNQTCLDAVQREVQSNRSINISILDTDSTRFESSSPIGTILENMMIETWNVEMNYDEYFQQCAPEKCVYTYMASLNRLYVVTTIVGLFGGLSVALKIIILTVVRWMRNRIRTFREPNIATVRSSIRVRARVLWNTVDTKLFELNLFKTELSWDDERRRRKEILTTRIYILLLVISNAILVLYTLIDTRTHMIKILNPSQEEFTQFRFQVPSSATFDCPCENILIPYQSFISIQPHFHQLCSSDFTTTNSTWLDQLYLSTVYNPYSADDYRRFVAPQFQLLRSLCTFVNDLVSESVRDFLQKALLSEKAQFRQTIESQANTTFSRFRLSTPRTFVRNLDFLLSMAQGNGILSYSSSNWHFLSSNDKFEYATIWNLPYSYGNENCSCATDATCITEASIDGLTIPGFFVGCYPLESLLQSTLECLYNISCIDQIKSIGNLTYFRLNPLDPSLSNPQDTVQSLVNNLLIERWETNVSYEQYYDTCAPLSCTSTFDDKLSLIYTVTTIIGLQGGLSVSLKLLVPIMITIGYGIVSHRYRRVEQGVTVITMTADTPN